MAIITTSCTVQDAGIDIETSIEVNECEESGSTNCVADVTVSQLAMTITSANPIRPFSAQGDCISNVTNPSPDPFFEQVVTPNRLYCFDISGYCNEGTNASASVVIVNPPSFIRTPLQNDLVSNVIAECNRGRFRARIAADFESLPLTTLCQRQTIELELIGKTINDEEERNPSQARKFVDILASAHYDCSN